MNLYQKRNAKLYSFLVNDTKLPSDNTLCFRCNLLERLLKVIMTNDVKIRDEKLIIQY